MLRNKPRTTTNKPVLELNDNDRLIRDEVKLLNNKNNKLPAYAFTKQQCDEIIKRCNFKTKVHNEDGVYVIERVGKK